MDIGDFHFDQSAQPEDLDKGTIDWTYIPPNANVYSVKKDGENKGRRFWAVFDKSLPVDQNVTFFAWIDWDTKTINSLNPMIQALINKVNSVHKDIVKPNSKPRTPAKRQRKNTNTTPNKKPKLTMKQNTETNKNKPKAKRYPTPETQTIEDEELILSDEEYVYKT